MLLCVVGRLRLFHLTLAYSEGEVFERVRKKFVFVREFNWLFFGAVATSGGRNLRFGRDRMWTCGNVSGGRGSEARPERWPRWP